MTRLDRPPTGRRACAMTILCLFPCRLPRELHVQLCAYGPSVLFGEGRTISEAANTDASVGSNYGRQRIRRVHIRRQRSRLVLTAMMTMTQLGTTSDHQRRQCGYLNTDEDEDDSSSDVDFREEQ
jgi:hypothetical protein